jgi:hypothetical protein
MDEFTDIPGHDFSIMESRTRMLSIEPVLFGPVNNGREGNARGRCSPVCL